MALMRSSGFWFCARTWLMPKTSRDKIAIRNTNALLPKSLFTFAFILRLRLNLGTRRT